MAQVSYISLLLLLVLFISSLTFLPWEHSSHSQYNIDKECNNLKCLPRQSLEEE